MGNIFAEPINADGELERENYRILAGKGLQKSFREIKGYDRIEIGWDGWNTAEAKAARDKEP